MTLFIKLSLCVSKDSSVIDEPHFSHLSTYDQNTAFIQFFCCCCMLVLREVWRQESQRESDGSDGPTGSIEYPAFHSLVTWA